MERSLAGRPTVRRGKEGTFFLTTSCQGLAFRRQSSARPSHTVATNVTASSSTSSATTSISRVVITTSRGARDLSAGICLLFFFFSFLCINSPGLADDDDDDDEAHAHHHQQGNR